MNGFVAVMAMFGIFAIGTAFGFATGVANGIKLAKLQEKAGEDDKQE